jgi:hypothetical protein
MNTISRLALAIAALVPAGISHAGPAIFDMDISLYYEDKATGTAISFSSSKHDTEDYKSSYISWVDQKGQYYSCTSKDSTLNIPAKAKSGSVSVTVDKTWICSSFDKTPIPLPLTLAAQCRADGQNNGTGTGRSRRTTDSGVRRYSDRYDSNSANCQISLNGAAPVTTQGWLLNKQSKLLK